MPDEALLARIDRLESLDEIRQLAAKYSLALDMRDLDAMVNLFPKMFVWKRQVGRAHFKQWMDETLRVQFTGTSHQLATTLLSLKILTVRWAWCTRRTSMKPPRKTVAASGSSCR